LFKKPRRAPFGGARAARRRSEPFCDGSHKGTGLGPRKVDIAEAKTVAWCGCKHSKNGAFCDGSHSHLP